MPPAFLDIVAAFALFRRSAINLPIIVTLFHNTILPLFCRAHPLTPYKRLVYILKIHVKYIHFRSRRTLNTSYRSARQHLSDRRIYIPGSHLYLLATLAPNARLVFSSTARHLYIRGVNTRLEAKADLLANTVISGSSGTSKFLQGAIPEY